MSEISEKVKVRLLGGDPIEPAAAPPLHRPAQAGAGSGPPAPGPKWAPPIFLSDSAEGADLLEATAIVQPLAQLCVTEQVQTPFLAAIAGAPGAGKTFALKRLARAIEALAGSAGALGQVVVAQVDASDGGEAPVALASAAYAALDAEPGGVDYSALLDESTHAGGDPLRAAKAASDRHDEIVRKLEAERAQRDEVEARAARLADTLLLETPGSRVDVFARARRGAIDARLRRFDLAGSDADASYRDLVRDLGGMGPGGRAGVALRSVWAYGAQRRLLFWAIVAFILGAAASFLHGEAALSAIRGVAAQLADWIATHADWLDGAAKILSLLGALALALNIWRAFSFSSLLLRGAQLLDQDVRDRRRDLENRVARLNQRVAALSSETDAAAKRAEAASRRAGGKAASRAPGPDFLDARHAPAAAARAFLAALAERIMQGRTAGAPDRLVFLIDNLDALSAGAAIAWIETAQSVIGAGSIGVLALDPARLVDPLGGPREARRRFDKWLQAVVNLPRRVDLDGERLVASLLSADGQAAPVASIAELGTALVEPLSPAETALLTALAPLAAQSPRGAKRFLNAYRLARCSSAPWPVVALMQAVAFADEDVRTAIHNRLAGGADELDDFAGPEALVKAVKSARAANGGSISIADARAAEAVARRYALSL
ncbi:MAG TPA: hypothetical protein VFE63_16020 [Roseiarcus sp.]|nr:hypothetical protein [Roseiarcus sp.]